MSYEIYKRFFREKPAMIIDGDTVYEDFGSELGKIESVDFGLIRGFLLGLKVTLKFGACGTVLDFTLNMSDECKWKNIEEKHDTGIEMLQIVKDMLVDGKANDIESLINRPIEVYSKGLTVIGFRILKEVL